MTVLDWAILLFTVAFAIGSYRRGPLAGLLTLGGSVAIAIALVWILGAMALRAPGAPEFRHAVQRSLIVGELNQVLPPPGPVLDALERVDQLPRIAGPTTPVAPPDAAIASDPDVRRVSRSVVRVLGTACGLGVEGSGWVAAPGLVVTNAHVVAGEDDTTVSTIDGASLDATPVRYDPANDIAVLRIEASIPALEVAPDSQPGTSGAVLGYPENGPYAVAAARLGETSTAISEDSYGKGPIDRSIAFLHGSVRSGNSGGPLVDSRGRVMATVFAATTTGPPGGFAVPNDVIQDSLRASTAPVDTGPCTG